MRSEKNKQWKAAKSHFKDSNPAVYSVKTEFKKNYKQT